MEYLLTIPGTLMGANQYIAAERSNRYRAELEKDKDWRKPQNGGTFFTAGYVDYLDANYVPAEASPRKKTGFSNFTEREYDFTELEKKLIGKED